jgi:hypothetical protein
MDERENECYLSLVNITYSKKKGHLYLPSKCVCYAQDHLHLGLVFKWKSGRRGWI